MQEAYPFTVKAKGKAKDKWDFLALGPARSRQPNEPLEVHQPDPRAEPLRLLTGTTDAGCGFALASIDRMPPAG